MAEGISALTLFVGLNQQRKAAKEQRKAVALERKSAALQNVRSRRRALAESRISVAEAISQATLSGGGGSSALSGAVGSVQTQTAANIGYQEQLNALNIKRLSALERSASYEARANTFRGLQEIGSNFLPGG